MIEDIYFFCYKLFILLRFIVMLIYWPILYIMVVSHELIHLITAVILRVHISSISLGTHDQSRVINIGYRLMGVVEVYVPEPETISEISTAYLIRLFIIGVSAAIFTLVSCVLLAWYYPHIFIIPSWFMLSGIENDMQVGKEITTELRKRFKNRGKLVLDK